MAVSSPPCAGELTPRLKALLEQHEKALGDLEARVARLVEKFQLPNSQPVPVKIAVREQAPRPDLPQSQRPEYRDVRPHLLGALQWAPPLLATVASSLICELLLAAATRSYAGEMLQLEQHLPEGRSSADVGQLPFLGDVLVGNGSAVGSGTPDPGFANWALILDLLAFVLSAAFAVGTVYCQDFIVWTRTFLAQAVLALSQGVIAVVTTLPPASGWPACRDHLGEDFVGSLGNGTAAGSFWLTSPVCAGLAPWSGRAAVTAVYVLGLYELCSRQTRTWGKDQRRNLRFAVVSLAVLQVFCEANGAISSRWSSSAGVLASSVIALLLYTNGAVAIAAKRWAGLFADPHAPLPHNERVCVDRDCERWLPMRAHDLRSDGTIFTPPWCLPFCCLHGHEHMVSEEDLVRMLESHLEDLEKPQALRVLEQLRMRPAEDLLTSWLEGERLP